MLLPTPDAQWIAVRRGRAVSVVAGIAPPPDDLTQTAAPGSLVLEHDDIDLAVVGPPNSLVAVVRGAQPRVVLYEMPSLEAAATLALDVAMRLAATTGPRLAVTSADGKRLLVVRVMGRALSAQAIEPGAAVEFVAGLERHQLLVGSIRKLEVFDAVSSRPLLRLQLQIPPPPRTIGVAQGHLWVTCPGSDELLSYRLSDGRPFRQHAGSPIEHVVCSPTSPVLVLVTARGLLRLHCFAHTLAAFDSPWRHGAPLAQLVAGDDLNLIGGTGEVWRIPIGGSAAATLEPVVESAIAPPIGPQSAADRLRALRDRPSDAREPFVPAPERVPNDPTAAIPHAEPQPPRHDTAMVSHRDWRDPIATYGAELAAGTAATTRPDPWRTAPNELAALADRLDLAESARNALLALYGVYLVGEPALSIAQLARILGAWAEPLGQGELGALAMVRRHCGRVSLRAAVTAMLDGSPPRAIRVVGSGTATGPRGIVRVARAGRSNEAIETELAVRLGTIAVIDGRVGAGVLEARLHGTTAVALAPPNARPSPWPRDAGLIVVADATAAEWIAALPTA